MMSEKEAALEGLSLSRKVNLTHHTWSTKLQLRPMDALLPLVGVVSAGSGGHRCFVQWSHNYDHFAKVR